MILGPADGEGIAPKRGDLLQTNVGNRRERTWIVLASRPLRRRRGESPRYKVTAFRWWELDARLRNALYRHAARHGGQTVFHVKRIPRPAPRRRTFEDDIREGLERRKYIDDRPLPFNLIDLYKNNRVKNSS